MFVRGTMVRIGLMLLVMLAPGMAGAQGTLSQENSLTYYYFAPEQVKPVDLLRWLAEQQILTTENVVYPLMGFFSILAQHSPEKLLKSVDEASLSGPELFPSPLPSGARGI